jgi:hypothetical protein
LVSVWPYFAALPGALLMPEPEKSKADKIRGFLMWPGAIVTALAAIWGVFKFISGVVGTGDRLTTHIVTDTLYHHQTDSAERALHNQLSNDIKELHGHALIFQEGLDDVLVGECVENSYVDLAKRKMLKKCEKLGIVRTPTGGQGR